MPSRPRRGPAIWGRRHLGHPRLPTDTSTIAKEETHAVADKADVRP
jgi:hypothetical protein